MKVAVFSSKKYERSFLKDANKGKHELLFIEQALSLQNADLAKGCEAASVFTNDDASGPVLKHLKELNIAYIATRAAGYDNIDLLTAAHVGIHVANVPEYSPYAIAEHTVAMILALNRKLIAADKNVKASNFALDNLIGFDLHGKTAGIVGLGKIGGIVAKILHGFGCKLLGYDIDVNPEIEKKYDLTYVSLQELYRQSDIITLHAPLNDNTKYLIKKDSIDLMKKGVMIVNTGRGGLIKTTDAIDALKDGKIGYLGLDVYENEKGLFFFDHTGDVLQDDVFARLLTFKNVLITGHQAFLTENALRNIADTTIYHLDCWSGGKRSMYELTKAE